MNRARQQKPNILLVMVDQLTAALTGAYGHPVVQTPNLDALAARGVLFTQFYVCSGVCSPSRTAVMTGQFPARYHIDGHFAWVRPPLAVERVGKRLRDDVQRITQDLARELEILIRRAPSQWHMFQPNWPSDPGYEHPPSV